MGQQLKGEGRGDLVGYVGHAQVKVGQLGLHDVALNDLQTPDGNLGKWFKCRSGCRVLAEHGKFVVASGEHGKGQAACFVADTESGTDANDEDLRLAWADW